MKRRQKLSRKTSKKTFRKGTKYLKKNIVNSNAMRGGIRL